MPGCQGTLSRGMLDAQARAIIDDANLAQDPDRLRELALQDYAVLLSDPARYLAHWPFLNQVLPRMPSADIQKKWVGDSDESLLRTSTLPFLLFVQQSYEAIRGPLRDVIAIDYGCGWGRFTRLLAKYTNPSNIWALDALDVSLSLLRDCGVACNALKIDPIPARLPIGAQADLAIAFSVFTHTSERTTSAALRAIGDVSKPGAVIVFTIRPVEFWTLRRKPELAALHERDGFAFEGDGRVMFDGEDTYGAASMSIEHCSKILAETGWQFVRSERADIDPYQVRVVARRSV